MRKETFNLRTINGKYLEINGNKVFVWRATCYAGGYPDRPRDLYNLEVYDYSSHTNRWYNMHAPEFRHLCRCHWVNLPKPEEYFS